MNQQTSKSEPQTTQDPQQISKWARVYAQNRSLGVVISLAIFLLLSAAIGGSSYLAGEAYRSDNMLLFWVAIAMLVPALAAVCYFANPYWGGKFLERLVQRVYAKEGSVAFSPPSELAKGWVIALAGCFVTCIVASIIFDFAYGFPYQYRQPISALFVVPFLVGLWLLMRPMAGYAALLWPLFYAIHAILIVLGAPILFTKPWGGLNMFIPIAGYGMLSGLVGHLYSRVALRRLKRLAQADQSEEVRVDG